MGHVGYHIVITFIKPFCWQKIWIRKVDVRSFNFFLSTFQVWLLQCLFVLLLADLQVFILVITFTTLFTRF